MEKRTPRAEDETNQQPNNRFQQFLDTSQRFLGATGATLALLGVGPAVANANHSETYPKAPSPKNVLKKPSSLSGYNVPLSPETRRQGAEATVQIRFRYTNMDNSDEQPWQQGCTAVKTTIDGQVRLSTAAHCFDMLTEARGGLIEDKPGDPKAVDFIEQANAFIEYAVFDPKVRVASLRKPLAKIDGISIGKKQDWALLSVTPLETPPEDVPRTFEQIPALKLASKQSEAVPRPARGQRVSLNGMPAATGDKQSSSLGRYLGRIRVTNQDGIQTYLDVVGSKPKTMAEDSCLPGASGGSFTATIGGKLTYVSGAYQQIVNETWAPALFNGYPQDSQPTDVSNEIEANKYWRTVFQNQLGVNTKTFSTLCGFTVNLPNSVNTLNSGFGVSIPAQPVGFDNGKGGTDGDSVSMK